MEDFGNFQQGFPDVGFVILPSGNKYKITLSEPALGLKNILGPFYNKDNDSFDISKNEYNDLITYGLVNERTLTINAGSKAITLPGKFKIIKSEDGDTTIQGMYYPNKGGRRRKTRRLFRRRLTKKLAKRSK